MGAVQPSWSVIANGLATHHPPRPGGGHDALRRVEIEIGLLSGREVLDPADPMAPINLSALPRW
jgi:hypothetical protein